MTQTNPDPLAPGHIPGQNPNTPERLPEHTRFHETGRDEADGSDGGEAMPKGDREVQGAYYYAGITIMLVLVVAMLALWVLPIPMGGEPSTTAQDQRVVPNTAPPVRTE